jgi:ferredoxin
MKIAIDSQKCLNKRFLKVKCTACIDVCPAKCISEKLEIGIDCTNCGLCLCNCPVEAISGADYPLKSVQQLVTQAEPQKLICQKCQPDSPWPCLGFLDPILLLAFMISKKGNIHEVIIYQEDCRTCRDEVAQHLAWTVEEANRLLSTDKKMIVISKKRLSGSVPRAVSRRQFFTQLWEASVSTVREVASPASEEVQPIPRRKLFISHGIAHFSRFELHHQTIFKTLVVKKACNACEMCSKVCSSGAISTTSKEGRLEIRHNPALCRNCGVCVKLCPRNAISLLPASSLLEVVIGQFKKPICTTCGKMYQPIGNTSICLNCMQNSRNFFV